MADTTVAAPAAMDVDSTADAIKRFEVKKVSSLDSLFVFRVYNTHHPFGPFARFITVQWNAVALWAWGRSFIGPEGDGRGRWKTDDPLNRMVVNRYRRR
jgi:hypothetical protein